MKTHFILLLSAALAAGALAQASPAAGAGPLTDEDYVFEALSSGSALARAGELAGRRGGSAAVRRLGEKIAQEQKSANNELLLLSRDNKLAWETAVRQGELAVAESGLADLRGKEFDAAFLKISIGELDHLIRLAERVADSGGEAVQLQAGKMLPSVRESLRQARQLLKDATARL